ncbi:MAG: signal peptidase I [Bryobacterales bacterium]|nr:signal peptidase I [Bryobacterales bacterium]
MSTEQDPLTPTPEAPTPDVPAPALAEVSELTPQSDRSPQGPLGNEASAGSEEPPKRASEDERHPIAEWAITVLLLLFGITFLVQAFVIPTGSMEDTLLIGDHLLVDKLSFAPAGNFGSLVLPYSPVKRGDIVVFRYPEDPSQTFVKRVIGQPGDHIRFNEQQLLLNGKAVTEHYVRHKSGYIDPYRDNFPSLPNISLSEAATRMLEQNVENGELIVPDGFYFVMGDNRDNSSDSRYWGFVPRRYVIGKPLIVYWSFDAPTERWTNGSLLNLQHARYLMGSFFSKTRWERSFRLVRGEQVE